MGTERTANTTRSAHFFSPSGFCLWIGATLGAVLVLPYVVALLPQAIEAAAERPGPPLFVLLVLSIAQSALLLGLTSFSGLWAARRLGLGAPVLDSWLEGGVTPSDLRRSVLVAIGLGLASGLFGLALDLWVFLPFDPDGLGRLVQSKQPSAWRGFLASFYGGIGEEVELRLFLLSFLALGIRRVRDLFSPARGSQLPGTIFWTANVVAAVLFGLGHLLVTATLVPVTPLLVVRAILLNGVIGVLAGALFQRRGIEMAMVFHFFADIVLHVTPPLLGY